MWPPRLGRPVISSPPSDTSTLICCAVTPSIGAVHIARLLMRYDEPSTAPNPSHCGAVRSTVSCTKKTSMEGRTCLWRHVSHPPTVRAAQIHRSVRSPSTTMAPPVLKPLACRSLPPWTPSSLSLRHSLAPFDVVCMGCRALHWIEERVDGTSKMHPEFSACCERGTISLPPFFDPPEPLYSLLLDTTSGTCLFDPLSFRPAETSFQPPNRSAPISATTTTHWRSRRSE